MKEACRRQMLCRRHREARKDYCSFSFSDSVKECLRHYAGRYKKNVETASGFQAESAVSRAVVYGVNNDILAVDRLVVFVGVETVEAYADAVAVAESPALFRLLSVRPITLAKTYMLLLYKVIPSKLNCLYFLLSISA